MIVDFFKTLIDKFNTDTQCGFCWNFIHARRDYSNLAIVKEKECCVQFILEDWTLKNVIDLNEVRDQTLRREYTFEVFIGLNSEFDIQYDNEIVSSDSNSKYDNYIKKIEDCLIANFDIKCDYPFVRLGTWTYKPKINYKDKNFDGGILKGTIIFDKDYQHI